jgi:hypothetical protein
MRNTACTYHATLGLNVRIRYVCLCVCKVVYCVYPYVRFWRRHWLQRMRHGRRMKTLTACCERDNGDCLKFKGESLKEKESRSKR